MQDEQRLKRADWIKAIITLPFIAIAGIQGLTELFKDVDSPFRFTPQQMGPYGNVDKGIDKESDNDTK